MVVRMKWNPFALVVVLLIASAHPALAQSQVVSKAAVSGGFALPMDFGNERIEPVGGDELTGGFIASGIWGEGAFFPSARISLHTGIDVPVSSYDTHWHHVGTAGFDAQIKHYDTVLSQLVGFRPRSTRRTEVIAVVGFGLVFARSVQSTTYPQFSTSGRAPTRAVQTNVDPSFLGGLNISAQVNPRIGIIGRVRARATVRREDAPDGHFGWFGITPSVGITLR
jgi:hypothetical protein